MIAPDTTDGTTQAADDAARTPRSAPEPGTEVFEQYRTAVGRSFVPLILSAEQPARFRGRIEAGCASDVHVVDIHATPHRVERTREMIGRDRDEFYKVSILTSGSCLLVQDGRDVVMRPRDVTVYDTSRPYTLLFDEPFHMAVLQVPHRLVPIPAGTMSHLTAQLMPTGDSMTQIVAPFLSGLAERTATLEQSAGQRLALSAVDMLTALFTQQLGADARMAPHEDLAGRARQFIERHLADPSLRPDTIAAALFISTRHLHGVFSDSGTTVAAWIRSQRLERCRRDLADPLLADRTISQIAARWAFLDAAHFSRAFKEAFGLTPRRWREAQR